MDKNQTAEKQETQIVGLSGPTSSDVELKEIIQTNWGERPPQTTSPPPPLTAQGAQIEAALKNSNPKVGDLWFIIPLNWWGKWVQLTEFKYQNKNSSMKKIYPNFMINSIDKLSAIPTSSIIYSSQNNANIEKILREVVENKLYVSVPFSAWELLVKWYGLNGPEIKRPITKFSRLDFGIPNVSVDMDAYNIYGVLQSNKLDKKRIIISKTSTVKMLKQQLISIFNVYGTKCRLWDYYNCSVYGDLENLLEKTLQDAILLDGQDVLLESNDDSRGDAREDSSSVKHAVQSTSNFEPRSLEDSGNINNKAQFIGPEFDKVFNLIYKKQNIEEYYSVRYLSKIHQSKFEQQFHSTFINYEDLASNSQSKFNRVKNSKVIMQYKNLKQLAESEFSGSVKYLNVTVELQNQNYNNQFNDLCFISAKYLPDIKQVNVILKNTQAPRQPPPEYIDINISLNESLIFRRVNFVCEDKEYYFQKKLKLKINCCDNNNIEIINCSFDSFALQLWFANKVTILNSSFKNVGYALKIQSAKSQVSIEKIKILDCVNGMEIYNCNNPFINNIKIQNCSVDGCRFQNVNGASLSNANIVGGETGICFRNCNNAKISDCTIKDFIQYGIKIFNSNFKYKKIDFQCSPTIQNYNRLRVQQVF